jgi:hypothetical protein
LLGGTLGDAGGFEFARLAAPVLAEGAALAAAVLAAERAAGATDVLVADLSFMA